MLKTARISTIEHYRTKRTNRTNQNIVYYSTDCVIEKMYWGAKGRDFHREPDKMVVISVACTQILLWRFWS